MEFGFSADEQAFRNELRTFLSAELPEWYQGYLHDERSFQATQQITKKMAEKGWLTAAWPKSYGGQDVSLWRQVIFTEEMALHDEPRGPGYMSLNWIGPSIMMFGTSEQKSQHLGRIAVGESYWCQGFSEPDSGSDLASLRTAAIRDGDDYIINGEKIWTSHVTRGEWMFLLARTNPEAPKHKGISVFLIPLDLPGIERNYLTSIAGTVGRFGQFVFTDVRVPGSFRLGPENEGWRIVIEALKFERAGIPSWLIALARLAALRDFAMQAYSDGGSLYDRPWVQERFASLIAYAEAGRLLYFRSLSEAGSSASNALASCARIFAQNCTEFVGRFAMELVGPLDDLRDNESWIPVEGKAGETWMEGTVTTIVAGTLEINKNILATRGLGLPR